MAKRKPTATQRLRKLLQQQVRRMQNRGYRINPELKEKIKNGKYQTLQSIRRNKYAKLYEGSSAEIDTDIVSGRRYRQYERKVSAQKGAETRRENIKRKRAERKAREATDRTIDDTSGYDETEWEETRAKQDEIDMTYANAIDEGKVMYRNILDLMEKFPREGRNLLYQGLESEIRQYGLDMVMAGMASAPMDVVQEAQNIIFYTGDKESTHRALVNFFDSITGTIRTFQDSMGIGEVMDQMTDMGDL